MLILLEKLCEVYIIAELDFGTDVDTIPLVVGCEANGSVLCLGSRG